MATNDQATKEEYVPSEKEIDQSVSKAKQIDKNIFKKIHPEEYKKEQAEITKKKQDDKQYQEKVKENMSHLNTEVEGSVSVFMQTA